MIEIVPYRQDWPALFLQVAGKLKEISGDDLPGIHHIGSTAVPGMAAKDIIDVQVSVREFDSGIEAGLLAKGFSQFFYTDHCPAGATLAPAELDKRFFALTDPAVHLHIRQIGRFNQRYALLCRDFLRNNTAAAIAYQTVKYELAKRFAYDPQGYYDIKDPVFDLLMAGAEIWAKQQGWNPSASDV